MHTIPETTAIMLARATARMRVAAGQRSDDAEYDGGQRRVRSQHEDAAGAEQRISQQRHDRRIKTIDARHADATAWQCRQAPTSSPIRHPATMSWLPAEHLAWRRVASPGSQRSQPICFGISRNSYSRRTMLSAESASTKGPVGLLAGEEGRPCDQVLSHGPSPAPHRQRDLIARRPTAGGIRWRSRGCRRRST